MTITVKAWIVLVGITLTAGVMLSTQAWEKLVEISYPVQAGKSALFNSEIDF